MKTIALAHPFVRLFQIVTLTIFIIFVLGWSVQPAQSMMAGEGLMWSVALYAPVRLVVCWENPSAAEPLQAEPNQASGAQRREWARAAVKRTWERSARVIFVGWQQCQDEANAVDPPHTLGPRRPGIEDENLKINITYSGASNNWGHGSWGDYQKAGVSLNLHCTGQTLKECIEYLAIHEFGHTLGFYHEEERSDWPNYPNCPRQSYPVSPPWWPIPIEHLYGSHDTISVMAYCSGSPTSLSPKDVSGVQRSYMRRQAGTLLSVPGSLCLSAHGNSSNGGGVFGWECDEAFNDQQWMYDRQQATLSISRPDTPNYKRCLDVDTNNYSLVQIYDCLNTVNQKWSFNRVEIRGYGGLCLTQPNAGSQPVTMQACTSSAKQLWRLSPGDLANTFQIRSDTGDLCLVANDTGGTAAGVVSCNLGPKIYLPFLIGFGSNLVGQTGEVPADLVSNWTTIKDDFYLRPGGQIGVPSSGSTSLCLDVADVWDDDFMAGKGGPTTGKTVQVFQCFYTQLNQQWNLSGDVISGGKCLTITGSGSANGLGAVVSSCNNSVEQDWDYYW